MGFVAFSQLANSPSIVSLAFEYINILERKKKEEIEE
jgi:hypothetical protein